MDTPSVNHTCPSGDQCKDCRKASLKKLAKWAVAIGVLLSLICHELPHDYQMVCKSVATVLSSC